MGYQESYVRIKDRSKFDNLVDLIRRIGKEYYEENGAEPVEIITLNKAIKGDLSYMCRPHEKYSFPIGERFIYFTGERYLQRSVGRLLNDINIQGVEIYFTECFPSDKIFEENEGDKYANHEEFTWDVSCENKNTIIEGNSLKKCKEDSKKQKESDVEVGYDEKNHQRWLRNLIEKKVSFLGKDEYASYFNIFINNEIAQIAYDGEMICSAIYLHKNVQENSGIINSTTVLKLERIKDKKIIKQLNDFIKKYISEKPEYSV